MSDDVISLANRMNDAMLSSPKQTLEEALKDIEEGNGAFKKCKKLLVLALDEEDGQYRVSFVQAGMKMSDCVGLCEVAKAVFLAEMNYV